MTTPTPRRRPRRTATAFRPATRTSNTTRPTTKTPGAVKAQDNNTFYKPLEREIDDLRPRPKAASGARCANATSHERVGPEAMIHLSERYEDAMAALP